MSDDRSTETEPLDDEFHSSLEVDDSSGWRVFIVPGVLLLFLIGAIAFIVLSQGESGPDPRIADRLKNGSDWAEPTANTAPITTPIAVPAENGATTNVQAPAPNQ